MSEELAKARKEAQDRMDAADRAKQLEGEAKARQDRRALDRKLTPFNGSDLTSRPKTSDILKMSSEVLSLNVANTTQIGTIGNECVAHGIPGDKLFEMAMDIVSYCGDNGSSPDVKLMGNLLCSPDVSRADIGAIIRKHCTLRQFCAYFAKLYWNKIIELNRPPANYALRGFKKEEAFVGFDFSFAVLNPAALEPADYIRREPNKAELTAMNTIKEVSIHRNISRLDTSVANRVEITGGKKGPKPQLYIGGPSRNAF
ncbi:CP [Garlic yellow stripe associated virus]|nr:CP [Garlic yellow stripe associated virus]